MKLTYIFLNFYIIFLYLISEAWLLGAIHEVDIAWDFCILPISPEPFGAVADRRIDAEMNENTYEKGQKAG